MAYVKDSIFLRRGMVFYKKVDEHQLKMLEENPDLLGKDRYYLVISNDNLNAISSTVIVVPITHGAFNRCADDVKIFATGGIDKPSYVCVTQIQTFNKSAFYSGSAEYKYTLKKEAMDVVDKSILKTLGIVQSPDDDFEDRIMNLVDTIVAKKEEEIKHKYSNTNDLLIQKIEDRISGAFGLRSNEVIVQAEEVKEISKSGTIHNFKIKWNEKLEKSFLDDYKKLSIDEMMKKYGICSKNAVYSKKYSLMKKYKSIQDD